jgi:hypothetical protein
LKAYNDGLDLSNKSLPKTHILHLGLALNCSVLYKEVLENPIKAIKISEAAFNEAATILY